MFHRYLWLSKNLVSSPTLLYVNALVWRSYQALPHTRFIFVVIELDVVVHRVFYFRFKGIFLRGMSHFYVFNTFWYCFKRNWLLPLFILSCKKKEKVEVFLWVIDKSRDREVNISEIFFSFFYDSVCDVYIFIPCSYSGNRFNTENNVN